MKSQEPLTRIQTPEEQEYRQKRQKVELKRQQVAELKDEVEELQQELGKFMTEYNARVGLLQVELEKLELAIDEVLFQIHWLLTQQSTRSMEEKVEETFSERRKQIHEDEYKTKNTHFSFQEGPRTEQALNTDEKEELKRIYRDLARRVHPDLASTEIGKARRHRMMAKINEAYESNDLEVLQELSSQVKFQDCDDRLDSITEKMAALEEESQRLGKILARLSEELKQLKSSSAYKLWKRVQIAAEQGTDYLQVLCSQLQRTIEQRREELAKYQARFEDLDGKRGLYDR